MIKLLAVPMIVMASIQTAIASCPEGIEGLLISPKEVTPQQEIQKCLTNSKQCIFSISKSEAEKITIGNGYKKSKEPWQYKLHWSYKRGYYVWSVSITTSKEQYSSKGVILEINAQTGKVCNGGYWYRDV